MRLLTSLALLAACGCAFAQTQPRVQGEPPADGRRNQRVELIHIEDGGAVIDEVRYAGQTQSVRVQPRGKAPAYEIQPTDMARTRPGDNRDGLSAANGRRVWNVVDF